MDILFGYNEHYQRQRELALRKLMGCRNISEAERLYEELLRRKLKESEESERRDSPSNLMEDK